MDRNAFLALLFSLIVFMLWTQWQAVRFGDGAPPPGMEGAPETVPAPEPRAEARPLSPALEPEAAPPAPRVVDDTVPGQRITVETALYTAELTTRGGALTRWELTRYLDKSLKPERNVVLTTLDAETESALYTPFVELGLGDLRSAVYRVERPSSTSVVFTRDDRGFRIRKIYEFLEDSYDFRLRLEVENRSQATVAPAFEVVWPSGKQESTDFADHMLIALHGEDVEREALERLGSPGFFSSGPFVPPLFDGQVDWAGAESRYFVSVLMPQPPREAVATFEPVRIGEFAITRIGYRPFPIGPGQSVAREFRGYIGPKELDRLAEAGAQLERSVDLGWSFIAPVTRLFGWLLRAFYNVIPNYGVAIILITILVKILTAPLTHKSLKSMQGMAALQPKMKEIQEKYKDDRQKQSEELMKLYREGGANPIAGCLPMLLQFPFFIGLYYALRSTISLRQAPFFGWIQDLSLPEALFVIPGIDLPVRVLPLIMGASMVLSQRMTPTTMDPAQARMMNTVMPVMFTVLFYQFASGLVLYWLVNNLLQIGQQVYMNRKREQSQSGAKAKSKG
ncbi:MAG: membrane protein insertase YidC [Deltaproteobacteria bacterium]|nr:MAG: membrane protein insertase YidC [Deltaproteobacteria bacterium]